MKKAKKNLTIFFIVSLLLLVACNPKEDKSNNNTATPTSKDSPASQKPDEPQPPSLTARPWDLIDRIREKQRVYVRDSYGINNGQCFTDEDLNRFRSENKISEIVNQLRNDRLFTDIVDTIRRINSAEQSRLLDSAQRIYRLPWSVLRLDPKTASQNELLRGQTDAGSTAERMIAENIVALVKQRLRTN